MAKDLRGISFPNGDLYVVDDAMNITHHDLAKWLKLGVSFEDANDIVRGLKRGYVAWTREGNTNKFWLGDTNNDVPYSEYVYIDKFGKKTQQTNSQYKFIYDYDSNEDRWFG